MSELYNYWEFHDKCQEIETRFGGTRGVPIKQSEDFSPLGNKKVVLNLGPGKSKELSFLRDSKVFTLDTDETLDVDFLSFDDVPEDLKFDAIYASQVVEHIPKEELSSIIQNFRKVLIKGGLVIATIPNVQNWFKYIGDYDHKNPITFYQLGSLFELAGLKVKEIYKFAKMHRYHSLMNEDMLSKKILDILLKYFEMDPYDFICVVAQKEED